MPPPPKTKREHLKQLVDGKSRWNRPLTDAERALGFLGWHERGYLPHCDYPGLLQLVTFRLADSMPAGRRSEWAHLLKIENSRTRRTELEHYLDRGIGDCHLRDARIATAAEESLRFFSNQRYELRAWCVMPNHIHVLVYVWDWPLSKIVLSWKRYIATRTELLLAERRPPARRSSEINTTEPGRRPALQTLRWQREYWDTVVDGEDHERKAIRYIEDNPTKANLSKTAAEWPFSSAQFRDKYGRLVLPA
jgi:putative transposase